MSSRENETIKTEVNVKSALVLQKITYDNHKSIWTQINKIQKAKHHEKGED